MAISAALGTTNEIELPTARIRYHDTGEGPPVLFVHGLLVNSDLWRKVVPAISAAGHRCITPDWPLGAHSIPVPDADLSPTVVADLVATFIKSMNLRDVTVVANDTGGAITQVLMSRHPERIGRVVLTPSDSYERFLPPAFAALPVLARMPGSIRPLTQLCGSRPHSAYRPPSDGFRSVRCHRR